MLRLDYIAHGIECECVPSITSHDIVASILCDVCLLQPSAQPNDHIIKRLIVASAESIQLTRFGRQSVWWASCINWHKMVSVILSMRLITHHNRMSVRNNNSGRCCDTAAVTNRPKRHYLVVLRDCSTLINNEALCVIQPRRHRRSSIITHTRDEIKTPLEYVRFVIRVLNFDCAVETPLIKLFDRVPTQYTPWTRFSRFALICAIWKDCLLVFAFDFVWLGWRLMFSVSFHLIASDSCLFRCFYFIVQTSIENCKYL